MPDDKDITELMQKEEKFITNLACSPLAEQVFLDSGLQASEPGDGRSCAPIYTSAVPR